MAKHPWRVAALLYLAVAIVYTWPLAVSPSRVLAAPQGPGDPYLNAWILGWDLDTITTQPRALLTGRVFNANIFHPAATTLAYSDHLLVPAVVVSPVYLATRSVTLCYNLVLFGSLLASALAMFAFARALTRAPVAALAAGLVWGFWPFHFSHLIHLQLQGMYFLPLAFLFLHRLVASRRVLDAVCLGAAVGLQAATSIYIGVIGAVGLAVAGVVLGVSVGRWRNGRLITRIVLAVIVAVLVVAPLAWPYLDVQRREGFVRNLYQAGLNEASATSYLRVAPDNLLYGRTGLLRPAPAAEARGEKIGVERELFVGFTVMLLALFAVWQLGVRERRAVVWPLVSLVVVGFVLSLGPDGVRPLYAWLHAHVFGFQAIRAPARFGVLVAFGCAGLAALALDAMAARRPRLVWLALAAIALEYANAPLPLVPAPETASAVGAWLRDAPGPGAVIYLPLGLDAENTPFMLESLQHRRPIVNGYSGQRPSFFTSLVDTMREFPSADALWTLRDLDVRFVVATGPIAPITGLTPLVKRATFANRTIYELVWTPEIEDGLARPDLPAPPLPPPTLPFAAGEVARYRILWGSSPSMALSAGDIVLTVQLAAPPLAREGESLQFELAATPAPWVSAFFDARDRFISLTRADLLPTLHVQQIREGRRVLDRVAAFDPARRVVRSANGPPDAAATAPGLPLAPGARDPLSAFYYARAVPLTAGATVRIPVNDFGRSRVVELRAGGEEPVTAEGRSQTALRLEGRIEYRIEHRRSPRTTLWLSTDGRRIPLVIEIDAPFGQFRAELVEYRAGTGQ